MERNEMNIIPYAGLWLDTNQIIEAMYAFKFGKQAMCWYLFAQGTVSAICHGSHYPMFNNWDRLVMQKQQPRQDQGIIDWILAHNGIFLTSFWIGWLLVLYQQCYLLLRYLETMA